MKHNTLKYGLIVLGLCFVLSISFNIYGLREMGRCSDHIDQLISVQQRESEKLKEQSYHIDRLEISRSETDDAIAFLFDELKRAQQIQDLDQYIADSRTEMNRLRMVKLMRQNVINCEEELIDQPRRHLIQAALCGMIDYKITLKTGLSNILAAMYDRDRKVCTMRIKYEKENESEVKPIDLLEEKIQSTRDERKERRRGSQLR